MSLGGHPRGGLTRLREPQSTSFFGWVVIFWLLTVLIFSNGETCELKKERGSGHFHTIRRNILYQIIWVFTHPLSHRLFVVWYNMLWYDIFIIISVVVLLRTPSSNPKKMCVTWVFLGLVLSHCVRTRLPPPHPKTLNFVQCGDEWWTMMTQKKSASYNYLHFVDRIVHSHTSKSRAAQKPTLRVHLISTTTFLEGEKIKYINGRSQ
jgi:hypothetical protein